MLVETGVPFDMAEFLQGLSDIAKALQAEGR